MSDFRALQQADRRLVILRVLAESSGYSTNEHLLRTMVGQLGHQVGAERMRADVSDLDEMGLVTTSAVAGVVIVMLTEKGLDVSNGLVTVEGVKRPAPGRG